MNYRVLNPLFSTVHILFTVYKLQMASTVVGNDKRPFTNGKLAAAGALHSQEIFENRRLVLQAWRFLEIRKA